MIQNIIFLCSLPVIFGFNLDQTHPPTILGRDEKLRISTLPNTLSFDQQIDWNQGTVYDQSHQPLLTTSPSQMPDLIDIRGGNDDNDQIITSLNLVSCSSSSFLNSWTVFQTLNPLWSDHHHELLIWFITFLIWFDWSDHWIMSKSDLYHHWKYYFYLSTTPLDHQQWQTREFCSLSIYTFFKPTRFIIGSYPTHRITLQSSGSDRGWGTKVWWLIIKPET